MLVVSPRAAWVVVMTSAVITPVVIPATPVRHAPSAGPRSGPVRRTLPLPTVPIPRAEVAVYGMAAVDSRGRVADQTVLRALAWAPGSRLNIRETRGLLLVRTHEQGALSVTKQGHLRLPAPVRHRCSLIPGDRVLLAAYPQRDLLIVHPPAALDDLLAQVHAGLLDGGLG